MIKPLWWIPISLCFISGIIYLIPASDAGGPKLAWEAIVPLAPIPSIVMWAIGIVLLQLAKWSTGKPLRPM